MGVFHAKGWGSKTSCPPSKVCLPWVSKRGIWDIPGILPGCPGPLGVFKKFVQKKFVLIFRSSSRFDSWKSGSGGSSSAGSVLGPSRKLVFAENCQKSSSRSVPSRASKDPDCLHQQLVTVQLSGWRQPCFWQTVVLRE